MYDGLGPLGSRRLRLPWQFTTKLPLCFRARSIYPCHNETETSNRHWCPPSAVIVVPKNWIGVTPLPFLYRVSLNLVRVYILLKRRWIGMSHPKQQVTKNKAGGGGTTDLQATLIAIACGDQERASQAIKRIIDKNSNASIKQDDLAHLSTARLKVLSHTTCWDWRRALHTTPTLWQYPLRYISNWWLGI